MARIAFITSIISIALTIGVSASADETLKSDNEHSRIWNKFANDILTLHKQLIQTTPHTMKEKIGGYANMKKFYKEQSYYDERNGKLISRVQWERENPTAMHAIEVFVRNEKGQIIRDYTAAYLPKYRNAPTQTLLSFHAYNGKLHAFRTFDASGARIVERCTGKLDNEEVNMILDEDEIYEALEGNSNLMEQEDYQACFKGLPQTPGKYLTPQ